ncbi:hypothetical protein OG587_40165 [Streptosporangium sp. NBC_01469]|nr:hypothetical protein [Streptosporangium sp. NBC_01469]
MAFQNTLSARPLRDRPVRTSGRDPWKPFGSTSTIHSPRAPASAAPAWTGIASYAAWTVSAYVRLPTPSSRRPAAASASAAGRSSTQVMHSGAVSVSSTNRP